MSAYANLAINDSAQTPESPGTPGAATRTFVPGGKEGNVWTWYENTTGTTAATRSKLTASLTPGDSVTRMKLQLALPKSQTVDGLVTAAHVTRGFVEFIFPANGSRDDRRDIKALLIAALNTTELSNMVGDLEGVAA